MRFFGEDVKIISKAAISINNCIQAEWITGCFPDNEIREEKGCLYLLPIDDYKFRLQLIYLYETEAEKESFKACSLTFLPAFFDSYPAEVLMANQPFRFDRTTEQGFAICAQTTVLLHQLKQRESLPPFLVSLKQSETAIQLLRRSLECITAPFNECQLPACRFLAYDSEREKIQKARSIIDQQINKQYTIRELSRKVAMNECYLKKGFKALTGKTIHEYHNDIRIARAKELLQQQGRSVSEVADMLGYSSISHFSTAFKKATGIKACELLR